MQAFNDFVVFGCVAVGSFISGGLLETYGWEVVCAVALPPLVIASVSLTATGAFRRMKDTLDPRNALAVPPETLRPRSRSGFRPRRDQDGRDGGKQLGDQRHRRHQRRDGTVVEKTLQRAAQKPADAKDGSEEPVSAAP